MPNHSNIDAAVKALKLGQLIVYPTEAIYGLGCDPFNEDAVKQLLQLKQRPVAKGLILIAANWEQIVDLIELRQLKPQQLDAVQATWPGPHTWVFPTSHKAPEWISGEHKSIALRISQHLLVRELCEAFGGALVSTSANLSGQEPLRDYDAVCKQFHNKVAYILPGACGDLSAPTSIRDAMTLQRFR